MKILITGGAGYIGSHIAARAFEEGHEVLIYDNFSNHDLNALRCLTPCGIRVEEGDILEKKFLTNTMKAFKPDLVIHTAGLKSVPESISRPLDYYQTNVQGTVNVLAAMEDSWTIRLMFSSSAAVYSPRKERYSESSETAPSSPYGRSKLMAEQIIKDFVANRARTAICFRYFNPIGSRFTRFSSKDGPFMDRLVLAASGKIPYIELLNNGETVRDFIHIEDLAEAHFALTALSGYHVVNLGSGIGHTLNQVVKIMEIASGKNIPVVRNFYKRQGDVDFSVADTVFLKNAGNWRPKRSLLEACMSAWDAEDFNLSID